MKKRIILGILLVWSIVYLSACGTVTYEELAEQPELVVYTPLAQEVYLPVIREFENRYDINVEVFEEPEEEIVEQARMKRENFQGDVVLGLSEASVVHNTLLFPHKEVFSSSSFVIIYNENIVLHNEIPENFESLLSDKWNGKIGFPNPEKSVLSKGIVESLETVVAKDKKEEIRTFYENIQGECVDSIEEVGKGVCAGRYVVGIVSKALAEELIARGENIEIVPMGEEECIVSNIMVSTLNKDHTGATELFFQFATGADVQRYLTEYLKYEPVYEKGDDLK